MTGFYLSLIIFIAFNLTLCQSKWILGRSFKKCYFLSNLNILKGSIIYFSHSKIKFFIFNHKKRNLRFGAVFENEIIQLASN